MDLSQLLSSGLSQEIVKGIGQQVGTSQEETASVVNASLPVLMGMLKNNASNEQGAASLLGALNNDHNGSILDNLSGFLNAGDTSDGNGILSHILGGNRNTVENQISQKTGVSSMNVSKILALLAPIIMGYLGKQKQSRNVSTGGGLGDLLGGMIGGTDNSSIGGSILSSVLEQAMGGQKKKKGGLGGLLGGILGGK